MSAFRQLLLTTGIALQLILVLPAAAQDYANVRDRIEADAEARSPLVAHVTVVLCTNRQKVTDICNENIAKTNLYWGAQFGVRAYFMRQKEWEKILVSNPKDKRIIDRVLFKRTVTLKQRDTDIYLVADVWRGGNAKEATAHFLTMTSGENIEKIKAGNKTLYAGGDAHMTAYIGHNVLAKNTLDLTLQKTTMPNSSVVLGRNTATDFSQRLRNIGSFPLITTNGRMTPDAHTLESIIVTWFSSISPSETRNAAAEAYKKLRGGSVSGRKKLFVTSSAQQ